MKPDLRDIVAFLGLLLIGVGAWLLTPAAAFLVVGVSLFVLGVWGKRL